MTGYGKAASEFGGKKIVAEIKSLNSKAIDLSTRIAPLYREKEMEIRAYITKELERGKVDFSLWIENTAATAQSINKNMFAAYLDQMRRVSDELDIEMPDDDDLFAIILRMPDVLTRCETEELTEEEWNVARSVTEQAVQQLEAFRRQEGEALQRKFEQNISRIAELQKEIEPYEKLRVERIRQRIVDGLAALPEQPYDNNRLEQEMIYYIEKLDINEEKQRLTNHLNYFRETMNDGHGQGKKLGFIAQEMGREINTTGSKSNLAEMQNLVVMMKDQLEQIKEQVLNVL